MSNPLGTIWEKMFPPASKRTQEVEEEIDFLRQIEERRERQLATVSSSLVSRAKELEKMVEEMKETRRGQND
jgi:hypothetical protein